MAHVVSAWLTPEQHTQWRARAFAKGLTVSAYTKIVIESQLLSPAKSSTVAFKSAYNKDGGRADQFIKVALTRSENQALREISGRAGLSKQKFLVTLIRAVCAQEAIFQRNEVDYLVDATVQLRKIGVNVNQIAHVLNEKRKSGDNQYSTELKDFLRLAEALNSKIDSVADLVKQSVGIGKTRSELIRKSQCSKTSPAYNKK